MSTRLTPARKLSIWVAELRAPFFTAAIVPAVLGAAMAWYETDRIDMVLLGLTLLGVVSIHGGTNVVNDYFDFKSGTDRINKSRSQFNGGSPFIVEGVLGPEEVYRAAALLFAIGSAIGFYLAYVSTPSIIALGIIGVALGYSYTNPKVNLAAKGVGEIAVGAGFGPLVVGGAYVVQTGTLSPHAFIAGIPVGLLIGLVLFINQFPDREADAAVGKNHWVVRLGTERSSAVYVVMLALAFSTIPALWMTGVYPIWTLLGLLSMLIAPKAIEAVLDRHDDARALIPAQAITVQMHLLSGLLIPLGFLVSGLL